MYKKNELNGEKIIFYPSGLIKESGGYIDGKKNGLFCNYDTLGVELNCVKYKKGIQK